MKCDTCGGSMPRTGSMLGEPIHYCKTCKVEHWGVD